MRLGAVLKKWRMLSGLEIREAADQIGIASSTLRRVEEGAIPPHGETLIKLLNWLLEPEMIGEPIQPISMGNGNNDPHTQ